MGRRKLGRKNRQKFHYGYASVPLLPIFKSKKNEIKEK